MKEKLIKLITICDKYEKEYQAATTLFNENETEETEKAWDFAYGNYWACCKALADYLVFLTKQDFITCRKLAFDFMRKTYKNRKEDARLEAIEYQQDLSESNYSYGELIKKQSYFESLAKRYGLTEEFKENGII